MIVKDYIMRGSSRPYPLILCGPMRSIDNMSRAMASASLEVNFPYLRFVSCYSDKSYKPQCG